MASTNFASVLAAANETSHDLAYPSSVQAGSTLVVGVAVFPGTPSTPTVAAGANAGIVFVGTDTSTANAASGETVQMFYAQNAAAGATTIHCPVTGVNNFISITQCELTGRAATSLDKHAKNTGTGTAVSGGGLTSVVAGSDVISTVYDDSSATTADSGLAAGYSVNASSEQDAGLTGNRLSLAHKDNSGGGSESPTWTLPASSDWVVYNAAFLVATGAVAARLNRRRLMGVG